MQGQGLEMCREQFLAAACPWHRAKGNMALPAPTSPGHQTCSEDGKKKKRKRKKSQLPPRVAEAMGLEGGGRGEGWHAPPACPWRQSAGRQAGGAPA